MRVEARQIVLSRCSPAFVAQALMIPNMTRGARVESVFVSYWCDPCERGDDVLLESVEQLKSQPTCATCRQPLDPDTSGSLISHLFRAHA
jgi:hypothetical protein